MATASFRDQLKAVKPAVKVAVSNIGNLPDSANHWVKDGVDHINIARQAMTSLGKTLNLDHVRNWEHSVLGPFRSLNSLWYFLRAANRSDTIRTLSGGELRRFVDSRCGGFGGHLPNFRIMILDSMYKRIKACSEISAEMIRTVLPFDSYRENESGIRIRFEHTPWIVAGYEEIRSALKEMREPNFTSIAGRIEGDLADIYKPILKQLVHEPTEEEINDLLQKKKAAERQLKKTNAQHHHQRQEAEKAKQPASIMSGIQNIDSSIDDETLDNLVNGNVDNTAGIAIRNNCIAVDGNLNPSTSNALPEVPVSIQGVLVEETSEVMEDLQPVPVDIAAEIATLSASVEEPKVDDSVDLGNSSAIVDEIIKIQALPETEVAAA